MLAPFVGRIVDRSHPRPVVGFGFAVLAISLTWLSVEMTPTTPIWRLLLPFAAMGVGMAFVWAPLAATATRNLPPELAGAGSGVYNATRQVGSVLGSAGMAAFMTWRISDELPPMPQGAPCGGEGAVSQLPAFLHQPFSDAMAISTLLPAFVALFGIVAALFLVGGRAASQPAKPLPVVDDYDSEPRTEELPVIPAVPDDGGYVDDGDNYAEYILAPPEPDSEPLTIAVDDCKTDPLRSAPEPIGFAHNGLYVEDDDAFRHATDSAATFTWFDPDADSYGRHSTPSTG